MAVLFFGFIAYFADWDTMGMDEISPILILLIIAVLLLSWFRHTIDS
jgi:hypothetical protein